MTDHDLFTLARPSGRARRDAGCARVASNNKNFQISARAVIESLAEELPEFTADEVRERLALWGVVAPHPNAYGAAFLACARAGVIKRTDRTRQSTRAAAHAHANPLWQSLIRGK